ncbi:DsbA family oxidoreductase [Bauldia litoralis]|uniref:DsbA family oxidoreductase n=1 Tax=Bauldia litoralis TaxID=665467 RepID=UPI003297B114
MTEATSLQPLQIDVVSDVVCPWCYLGKRRLDHALEMTQGLEVAVRWKPFRLDPTIPPEGVTRKDYLEGKFGSLEAVKPMHDQLSDLGRLEGIDFHFERITRSPSTVAAHRVIRWAEPEGAQDQIVERLFLAYFTEGLDIGDPNVLSEAADEVGLDAALIGEQLASDMDRATVEADIENAYHIGVTGVPCFIVAGKYAVMGAQEAPALAQALVQIATGQTA